MAIQSDNKYNNNETKISGNKGGIQMANTIFLPNTSATHAKPIMEKAILCMGQNL